MKKFLKNAFTIVYRVRHLIRRELQMKESVPWGIRLKMWFNGFLAVSYYRYNLKVNDKNFYISDYTDNIKALDLSHSHYVYLDNKLLFPVIVKGTIPVAKIIGLLMNGRFIQMVDDMGITNADTLLEYVRTTSSIFIKPITGSTGGNILKLEYRDGSHVLNNKAMPPEEILKRFSSVPESIIQPTVQQHDYARNIFPKTTNTIRVLTAVDPETGKPFIVHAVHRFGTSASFPVDNFAKGGISCNINIETGTVEQGAYIYPASRNMLWHTVHPESGTALAGVVIPKWDELKQAVLAVANQFNFMALVGWDVVITQDKFVLLEGNHGPDVKVHQIHKGLLTDPRMVRFYRHYQIIK